MKTITYDETKWKLVPVEPTKQMRTDAGDIGDGYELSSEQVIRIFQAMLTRTPFRPAEEATDTPVQQKQLLFPIHLRKMWSGSEVQAWLDEHLGVKREPITAKGSVERYK